MPDKLKQLKNGRLLIAAHMRNQQTEKLEQYLWYSDDNGQTWSDRVTVAASPDYNLCEVSILECEDGMLVAFLRENSYKGYDMMKCISYDSGETWSELMCTSIDCGHRPVSGFLQDGTVMVTYRFIPAGTQNMFAAFLRATEYRSRSSPRSSHSSIFTGILAAELLVKKAVMPLSFRHFSTSGYGFFRWIMTAILHRIWATPAGRSSMTARSMW